MPKGNFTSAKLNSNGTVSVVGPFSPGPGDPMDRTVVIAFYLLQDSTSGGQPVKVDGTGGWWPEQTDWFGECGGGELKPGPAKASAIAILTHDDPAAFITFTWNDEVEIEAAD